MLDCTVSCFCPDCVDVPQIQGESVCQLDMEAHAEYYWKDEARQAREDAMRTCSEIKHTFQRVARDSKDATFLTHTVCMV